MVHLPIFGGEHNETLPIFQLHARVFHDVAHTQACLLACPSTSAPLSFGLSAFGFAGRLSGRTSPLSGSGLPFRRTSLSNFFVRFSSAFASNVIVFVVPEEEVPSRAVRVAQFIVSNGAQNAFFNVRLGNLALGCYVSLEALEAGTNRVSQAGERLGYGPFLPGKGS